MPEPASAPHTSSLGLGLTGAARGAGGVAATSTLSGDSAQARADPTSATTGATTSTNASTLERVLTADLPSRPGR